MSKNVGYGNYYYAVTKHCNSNNLYSHTQNHLYIHRKLFLMHVGEIFISSKLL